MCVPTELKFRVKDEATCWAQKQPIRIDPGSRAGAGFRDLQPGINAVNVGGLAEWGSRVKGRGQWGIFGELGAVALCQPGQTYFNISTASTLIAICAGEAPTHIPGCSPNKWSPPTKERKVEGWCV